MSIQATTKGIAGDFAITLLDGSLNPISGLVYSDVTVRYRKNGQTSFTNKALLSGEFNELGDGVYLLTFTGGELDTNGNFRIIVTGAFTTWAGDVVVIDDQMSLQQHVVSLKAALAALANTRDVDVLFNVLNLRATKLETRASELEDRAEVLQSQINTLLAGQ